MKEEAEDINTSLLLLAAMGPPSALIGDPTRTESDLEIVKGLQNLWIAVESTTKLPPMPPPDQGFPFGIPRPSPIEHRQETRKPNFAAAAIVTIIVMILFTGSRLAIRARNAKLLIGKDDLAITAGTILALVVPASLLAQISYGGFGKHIYDCTYHELYVSHFLGAIQLLFLFEALGVIKISIVLLYMRVSGFTSRQWMIIHWTLIATIIMYCLGAFFVIFFTCLPAGVYLDLRRLGRLQQPPTCINQSVALAVLSAVHVVTDFSLLGIPVILLWNVQMKWTKKLRVGLAGIFGLSSCTFALLRTITQYIDAAPDPTYAILDLVSYVLLDVTTAVVAASLPILSVLAIRGQHRYYDHHLSDRYRRRILLEGESDPTPKHTPHRSSLEDSTGLEIRSSSDAESAIAAAR